MQVHPSLSECWLHSRCPRFGVLKTLTYVLGIKIPRDVIIILEMSRIQSPAESTTFPLGLAGKIQDAQLDLNFRQTMKHISVEEGPRYHMGNTHIFVKYSDFIGHLSFSFAKSDNSSFHTELRLLTVHRFQLNLSTEGILSI